MEKRARASSDLQSAASLGRYITIYWHRNSEHATLFRLFTKSYTTKFLESSKEFDRPKMAPKEEIHIGDPKQIPIGVEELPYAYSSEANWVRIRVQH